MLSIIRYNVCIIDWKELKFMHSYLSNRWLPSIRLVPEGEFSNFIEGLGPGQLVGRQVLASPSLGDIQLSLGDKKGNLEVEVIRARGLQAKPGTKVAPGMQFQIYFNLFLFY